MLLIAAGSVPRGGYVKVELEGPAGLERFRFTAKGPKTLIPSGSAGLLSGSPEEGVDARGIQPFYTGILARMTNMAISIGIENEEFVLSAIPTPAVVEPVAAEVSAAPPAA
jgi:histidine phosphotransferase ChpT